MSYKSVREHGDRQTEGTTAARYVWYEPGDIKRACMTLPFGMFSLPGASSFLSFRHHPLHTSPACPAARAAACITPFHFYCLPLPPQTSPCMHTFCQPLLLPTSLCLPALPSAFSPRALPLLFAHAHFPNLLHCGVPSFIHSGRKVGTFSSSSSLGTNNARFEYPYGIENHNLL